MKRLPFYFANFRSIEDGSFKTVIDFNSHPFIFMKIQGELGRYWHLEFWKEITQEEYEFLRGAINEGAVK